MLIDVHIKNLRTRSTHSVMTILEILETCSLFEIGKCLKKKYILKEALKICVT
jgi:hypothetical protein